MKITIGTTSGFHLRHLATGLKSLGEDVTYYSYMPKFRHRRDGLSPSWAHSLFLNLVPTAGLALTHRLPSGAQSHFVEEMLQKMDRAIAARLQPCDVYVGLSSMAIESAHKARSLGAVVIIERGNRHVLSQQELLTCGGGKGLTKRYIERELASYDAADYITVLSEHSRQSFIDRGFSSERIILSPLGVDLGTFTPSPRPDGPLKLLFVGSWIHRKGVDLLVDVVSRNSWHLTHAGTAPQGEAPNHPRIRSVGPLNHTQLSELMRDHHILVLPSREDGFGMVILEALAGGLPVVASTMTGGPDIKRVLAMPQWIEIVEAGNALDLERAILEMYERQERGPTNRIRLNDLDRDQLSWERYALRYRDTMGAILSQSNTGSRNA